MSVDQSTPPLVPPETPPPARGWGRQLSQSSIPRPALPSLTGLRAALLGYIGEVERAVRERIVGEEEDGASIPDPSSPSSFSGSGEDETVLGASTGVAGPSTLRRRVARHAGADGDGQYDPAIRDRSDGNDPRGDYGPHLSLLNHLSSLREDIANYLPNRIPVPTANLGARGEWLRNLPHRLRIVDLSVAPALPPDSRAPSSPVIDESGSVEHARRKVIELVKAYLPDEEWAGWEKLGWEEQDPEVTSRRHSLDLGKTLGGAEEEEEEEPSWLFPNRTPASAQAMASRRRAVRSKSLGAANFPTYLRGLDMPKLVRTRTAPYDIRKAEEEGGEAAEEEEEEDLDAADILVHSELLDGLNLVRTSSKSALGPSVADALRAAQDGTRLIGFEDLPFLWRNNEHIITG